MRDNSTPIQKRLVQQNGSLLKGAKENKKKKK
jgi:hypothetical protein